MFMIKVYGYHWDGRTWETREGYWEKKKQEAAQKRNGVLGKTKGKRGEEKAWGKEGLMGAAREKAKKKTRKKNVHSEKFWKLHTSP